MDTVPAMDDTVSVCLHCTLALDHRNEVRERQRPSLGTLKSIELLRNGQLPERFDVLEYASWRIGVELELGLAIAVPLACAEMAIGELHVMGEDVGDDAPGRPHRIHAAECCGPEEAIIGK